jgi:hypothetical protein
LKRISVVLGSILFVAAAANAHAVGLDSSGTGSGNPKPTPTPVAPSTICNVSLQSADVDYNSTQGMDKYKFTGSCKINVNPPGQPVNLQNVSVTVEAEWYEKMHRASEKVSAAPPLQVTFYTWATCNVDPFVTPGAACSDQGMGANKYSLYIKKEDAPFTRGKTTKAAAQAKTPIEIKPPQQQADNTKAPTVNAPANNATVNANAIQVKITPAANTTVKKFDVELQKEQNGTWQDMNQITTYDAVATPNGVTISTGSSAPNRRIRARSQGVANAQWSNWVTFKVK